MVDADLDGDGAAEIIAVGLHAPSGGISLLILKGDQFQPFMDAPADPPAIPWNAMTQPCWKHVVIPTIAGLEAIQGRQTLGLPGLPQSAPGKPLPISPTILAVNPEPAGGDWVTVAVNAYTTPGPDGRTSDYIVRFHPSDNAVEVLVNSVMRERAADWLRTGLTRIDFASDSLVSAWKRQFVVADHVVNEWPPHAAEPDGRP
jgi:hypothetical protein